MTSQIADLLMEELDAQGVGVVIEASHTCMTMRGIKKPGSLMVTSAMRGRLRSSQATRSGFCHCCASPADVLNAARAGGPEGGS